GPVVLLLLDVNERLLVDVRIEFILVVLLEKILVAEHGDLRLDAKAFGQILDVLPPEEAAAAVGMVIVGTAGASELVLSRVVDSISLDLARNHRRQTKERVAVGILERRRRDRIIQLSSDG